MCWAERWLSCWRLDSHQMSDAYSVSWFSLDIFLYWKWEVKHVSCGGETCVLYFTLEINFPVPARVPTSACLLLSSLKFLLLRNTDLLPTTPYFACASCLYLFKGFQNKHQWLLLNKCGCPCLNVDGVCSLIHVLIFIEFLPHQLPSLLVFPSSSLGLPYTL